MTQCKIVTNTNTTFCSLIEANTSLIAAAVFSTLTRKAKYKCLSAYIGDFFIVAVEVMPRPSVTKLNFMREHEHIQPKASL